ncbi:hypothetical protein RKD33_004487 [Streptomyces sp. SAI-129]
MSEPRVPCHRPSLANGVPEADGDGTPASAATVTRGAGRDYPAYSGRRSGISPLPPGIR